MSVYLGPSAAGRWLKCTASPGFLNRNADRLPKQTFDYTTEGIEAHNWAGKALETWGLFDYELIPKEEMRTHVRNYVEWVLKMWDTGDELIVETKIPLFYMAGRNGVVDAAIVGTRIIIADLKYGEGVSVDAFENVQLAIYAKSLLEQLRKKGRSLDPSTLVDIYIYQPRVREGEPIRHWRLTVAELELFCEPISSTAAGILLNPDGGDFYPEPEKVCRFCEGQSICGAYAQRMLGELPADTPVEAIVPVAKPSTLAFPAPQSLTIEQVSKVVAIKKDLENWLKDVYSYGKATLESGHPVPGHKLVQGKSNRQWKDEEEAARLLRREFEKDEVYETKLISPSKADDLLKGKDVSKRFLNKLQSLVVKPEGAPVMVPDTDKRPAYNAAKVFDNETIDLL